MVHAARAGARGGDPGLDDHVQLRLGTLRTHLENMRLARLPVGCRFIAPHAPHVHHVSEHMGRRIERGHAHCDRPETDDLVFGPHGAFLPAMWDYRRIVGDQGQSLPLRVLEVEHRAAVPLRDGLVRDIEHLEALLPPREARLARHAQAGADHTTRAPTLPRGGPVEERDVRAGRRHAVGVEKMIGRDVVLVHRLLHEAKPERLRVKAMIARRVGGDRGQMVEAGELHGGHLAQHSRLVQSH